MEGFIIALVVVAWFAAFVFTSSMAIDHGGPWLAAPIFLLILALTVLINASISENSKGPCLHYETQMHYNAATKTVMPAQVCVNRGEWEEAK